MAKSSIHIQRAVEGIVGHNSREHFSYSVVFTDDGEMNECTHTVEEAYKIYRAELKERTQAYENRTGQKLQKSAVTQLSAIINLEQHHTLKDLKSIKKHLEKTFNTKVYQMAIHRDEGKLISKIDGTELYSGKDFFLNPENKKFYFDKQFTKEIDLKDYEIVKNYHAHIEMMGLDSNGYAIRQKMNRTVLKEMQTFVAKELNMERGKENISYSKEEMKQILAITGNKSDYESNTLFAKKFNEVAKELGIYKEKRKRQDTHIFKDVGAVREEAKREALKELEALKVENEALKVENKDLKFNKKELEEEIKNLSKNLRETLKDLGASRADYAQLEQMNKDLKEELKNETLKHENILKSYQDLEKNLKDELTKKDEKIDNLAAENIDLKSEIEALKYQLDLKEKRSQSYFGLNQELKSEIIALKSQITDLQEQNDSLSSKVIELDEKVDSKPNMSERAKEVQEKLSAKFAEIDKKATSNEAEEPIKNRSVRKNR